jgi:hypothetical protein
MIRILAVVSAMLVAGPAIAEMAKAPAKPKPPKQVTVSGCTSSGYAGCTLLKAGKDTVLLKANAGAVMPPAKTFVVATGTMGAAPPNVCNVTKQFAASKIIHTKRKC